MNHILCGFSRDPYTLRELSRERRKCHYVNDLAVIGVHVTRNVRIAASATRFYAGEPIHTLSNSTYTAGVAGQNTAVVAAADTPVLGTHLFEGVAAENEAVNTAGTVIDHWATIARPIPCASIIRALAETAASLNTLTELVGLLGDVTLIDYSATGSPSSGPLFRIKDAASADTSGLKIVGGNEAKSELDVEIDPRAYRIDVA